jgi:hypothetical protein
MFAGAWFGQVQWHEHWLASFVGQLHWQVQALGRFPLFVVVEAFPAVWAAAAIVSTNAQTQSRRNFLSIVISGDLLTF